LDLALVEETVVGNVSLVDFVILLEDKGRLVVELPECPLHLRKSH
jgi:hypothetical protein